MEYPFISCKCITYGRVNTLEEALHSFLQQDYPGKKELIIVNDYPLQKLVFDHPEVKIFNLNETFKTIGEKENFATEQCSADIVVQWDDDDIALPHHLRNIAKFWNDDASVLHWARGVYYNEPAVTEITFIGNSGLVFNKKFWKQIGGHPIENAGYDMTFVERLHAAAKPIFASPEDADVSWFYMWGGRGYHQSGQGHDVPGKPNIIQRYSMHIETLRAAGQIPTGEIVLKPHWDKDYNIKLLEFLNKEHASRN